MHSTWISCCFGALLFQRLLAAPVNTSLGITAQLLARQQQVGPELGGVNFPDPSIIEVDGIWYSFATRTRGSTVKIQVARSNDFDVWGIIVTSDGHQYDALPNLPPWVSSTDWNTWAPDVQQLDDGSFIMYYSASLASDPRLHCVGVATASSVLGPYVPNDEPTICPIEQGGAIDASGYEVDGERYVVYKVDGNSLGSGGPCGNSIEPIKPTQIVLQPVEADGCTPKGDAVSLLDHNGISDDGIVEAPNLVRAGNTWILFFSSGCFTSPRYTVNYATADTVTGPYERAALPLFSTGVQGLQAPGGMSVHSDAQHMVFHANFGSGRALYTAFISIDGDQVTAL